VKYATAGAFRTALEHSLRLEAREQGIELQRLRREVVFQRLLARLMAVAPGRWILKGGLALEFRLGRIARSTRDMDLARLDSVQAATADFLVAQDVDLDDYFTFSIEKTDALDELTTGTAARYRIIARLAGRVFERVVVDVGFGSAAIETPDEVVAPNLLSFAGIGPVKIPTLPMEFHVAEKVHAYTRRYESGVSSRVKDLVDLLLISAHTPFVALDLRCALDSTFEGRGSHPLPDTLPLPPGDWGPSYHNMAREVGITDDITSGYELVSAFLNPVLKGQLPDDARWDPYIAEWR
jgi:hypothetical protein